MEKKKTVAMTLYNIKDKLTMKIQVNGKMLEQLHVQFAILISFAKEMLRTCDARC